MASMSTATLLLSLSWAICSGQGVQNSGSEPASQHAHKVERRRALNKSTVQDNVPRSHIYKRDLGNPSVSGYLLDLLGEPRSPVARHNLLPHSGLLSFLGMRSKAKSDGSASPQKSELAKEGHNHIGEGPASGSVEKAEAKKEESNGDRANPVRRSLSGKQPSDVSAGTKPDPGPKDSLVLKVLVNGSLVWDYGDSIHKFDGNLNPDQDSVLSVSDALNRDKRALQRLRSYYEVLRVHMQPGEIRMSGDKDGMHYHLQAEPPLSKKKTYGGGRPIGMSQEQTSADFSTLYRLLTALEGNISGLSQGPSGGSDDRRDTAAHPSRDGHGFDHISTLDGKEKMVVAYGSSDQESDMYHDIQVHEKGAEYNDRQLRKKPAAFNAPGYRKELREAKRLLEEFLVELNKRKTRLVS